MARNLDGEFLQFLNLISHLLFQTEATLTIVVYQPTDDRPIFQPDPNYFPQIYTKTVQENSPMSTPIIKLNATVATPNTAITYGILNEEYSDYFEVICAKFNLSVPIEFVPIYN